MFQTIDVQSPSRSFVVGDIHGCFDHLLEGLDKLGFDPNKDKCFSVGDLVDRGPDSHCVLQFLSQPWFHAIRGNHEQMCIDAGGTMWHINNGGAWFSALEPEDQRAIVRAFQQLPLLMQVNLPSGRKIGLAHASFPAQGTNRSEFTTDWNDAQMWADKTDWLMDENALIWDRYQIQRAKRARVTGEKGQKFMGEFTVKNIDHVFFGHTPLKEALTVGNMTWLDTGCFATGNLTIVEL